MTKAQGDFFSLVSSNKPKIYWILTFEKLELIIIFVFLCLINDFTNDESYSIQKLIILVIMMVTVTLSLYWFILFMFPSGAIPWSDI